MHENYLNEFSHFHMDVDGVKMHFIHAKSDSSSAIPLLLVHGWPGSVVEFLQTIPLLTAGEKSFNVVAPSVRSTSVPLICSRPALLFVVLTQSLVAWLCVVRSANRARC